MADARTFLDLTLDEWLDELAGPAAAPGGGSALAFALTTAAAEIAASGDLRVRPDAQAAAALAAGVARGAAALVEANLTAVEGDPRIVEARRLVEAADTSASRAAAVAR